MHPARGPPVAVDSPQTVAAAARAGVEEVVIDVNVGFRQALQLQARVISVSDQGGWAVADCGAKALGMDHGNPDLECRNVLFVSEEHVTFVPDKAVTVGDLVRALPAHCDPTMALHERVHLVSGDQVLETWPVDLRGW